MLEAAHAAAIERVERAERDGDQLRADESDAEQKMIEAVVHVRKCSPMLPVELKKSLRTAASAGVRW